MTEKKKIIAIAATTETENDYGAVYALTEDNEIYYGCWNDGFKWSENPLPPIYKEKEKFSLETPEDATFVCSDKVSCCENIDTTRLR